MSEEYNLAIRITVYKLAGSVGKCSPQVSASLVVSAPKIHSLAESVRGSVGDVSGLALSVIGEFTDKQRRAEATETQLEPSNDIF